jgi:alkaline phosphatase
LLAFGQKQSVVIHSHNDYRQNEPFYSAWEAGVKSVEADVHLHQGELYVAHSRPLIFRESKTLDNLYLQPLFYQIKDLGKRDSLANKTDQSLFFLWIDIKGEFEPTYTALLKSLERYKPYLCRAVDEEIIWGPVMIILSGNRDIGKIAEEDERWVFVDGRSHHLGDTIDFHLMPVISDHYGQIAKGESTDDSEQKRVEGWIHRVQKDGKWSRLWAAPDHAESWKRQWLAGLSFINTDQPARLAEIIRITKSNSTSKIKPLSKPRGHE